MMTRDEYIQEKLREDKIMQTNTSNYHVVFKCPKCMGEVVKDPYDIIQLTVNPPITKYLCKCTKCDYNEYI